MRVARGTRRERHTGEGGIGADRAVTNEMTSDL